MSKRLEDIEEVIQEEGSGDLESQEMVMPSTDLAGRPEFVEMEDLGRTRAMLATGAQAASLEWLDDAIEAMSPETANEWRQYLKESRSKYPAATSIAEIITPDLLDLASGGLGKFAKLGNHLSKYARGAKKVVDPLTEGGVKGAVGTDLISQFGEMEDASVSGISPLRSAQAGTIGGISSLVKTVAPSAETSRKIYTAYDPKAAARRSDPVEAKKYSDNLMKWLDKKGFFKAGDTSFDVNTFEWKRPWKAKSIKNKVKSAVVFPSQREMLKRIREAKKKLFKEIEMNIKGMSGTPSDSQQMDMFGIKTSTPGVYDTNTDIKNMLQDALDVPSWDSEAQRKAVEDILNFKLNTKATETGDITLLDIYNLKTELDGQIQWDKKMGTLESQKEQAFKAFANMLRDRIDTDLADTGRLSLLNRAYGDLSDMEGTLTTRVLKPKENYAKSGFFSGNMGYKLATFSELFADYTMGASGQIASTARKIPDMQMGNRAVRKFTPSQAPDNEYSEGREPQGASATAFKGRRFIDPNQALEMNFPKELMKTKLKRNVESISNPENARLLMAKFGQMVDKYVTRDMENKGIDTAQVDPMEIQRAAYERFKELEISIYEFPDSHNKLLPVLIQKYPDLFEDDEYGRINGQVPETNIPLVEDNMRRMRALGKISNSHYVKQLKKLHLTKQYDENEEFPSLISKIG